MTTPHEHLEALQAARRTVWNEAQGFLDECQRRHPTKDMSGEERSQWARYNERLDNFDAEIGQFIERATKEREQSDLRSRNAAVFSAGGPSIGRFEREDREADQLRNFFSGNGPRQLRMPMGVAMRQTEMIRAGRDADEVRSLLWDTGSVASAVPTLMAPQLYEVLEGEVSVLRLPTTKLVTASGANIDVPKLSVHAIGTQVIAQGTAIGGTDPTFAKTTLGAFKYGQLLQVASEVIEDAAVDVLGMIASELTRSVGRVVAADLVTGSGSGEPLGIMNAITGAGTIATGGSLIDPTYEKLVDLKYSINSGYRNRGNGAWLMHDSCAGTLQKLRDGNGGTLGGVMWAPSTTAGIGGLAQPDMLLGLPAYTDASVASLASNAKIVAFGDWSSYYIRSVGDLIFERSDDFAFNTDLVSFRAKLRIDGDLLDTSAINIMKRSV